MAKPTVEDAGLFLQLLEISQTTNQVAARSFVLGDFDAASLEEMDRKYPPGSSQRDLLLDMLGFLESAGVLVARGLLNEDIFFDAPFGFKRMWSKLEKLVADWSGASGDQSLWEHVRWLGKRYAVWQKEHWKPVDELFPPDRKPGREWGEVADQHVGFTRG